MIQPQDSHLEKQMLTARRVKLSHTSLSALLGVDDASEEISDEHKRELSSLAGNTYYKRDLCAGIQRTSRVAIVDHLYAHCLQRPNVYPDIGSRYPTV
jgi:hypothetical protein